MITPNYKIFEQNYRRQKNQLVFKSLPADLDTAVSLMLKLASQDHNNFLLESVTGGELRGRYSIIGMKPDLIWECHGKTSKICRKTSQLGDNFVKQKDEPLSVLRSLIEESKIDLPEDLPQMSAGLFGFLGYDMIRLVENLPNKNIDKLELPDAVLIRPTITLIIDGVKSEIILTSAVWCSNNNLDKITARQAYDEAYENIENVIVEMKKQLGFIENPILRTKKTPKPKSNVTKDYYIKVIKQAKKYIFDGEIFQVVPSQRWSVPFHLPPFSLYRALRRTNPSPYMFYFNFGDYQIVGASPEILVRVKDKKVTIRPIAGTRPRGGTQEKDKVLEDDLLSDNKELAEHLMLLDLGRNDVSKVCKTGTVKPTESFVIEKYSHVMHIVSNVEGELEDDQDPLSALLSGLPAGTVSGAPKVRAMEIIDELETEKRGIYGGGIGYFGANGEMDICIALRTGIIKDGNLYIQAGGGIVYDSDPDDEFQETVNKSKALLKASEEAINFINL